MADSALFFQASHKLSEDQIAQYREVFQIFVRWFSYSTKSRDPLQLRVKQGIAW